ncbi:ABC transporter substrate-binding protein [Crossiella sp. CA-258035]|uniref:ABC transporter substrate-binding protein n=1 Tax=Crossiella sp. CA-258035 TaxID=2981138 RepID=UPI0024BC24EE|nr:ABC transporter substrate-binding protein [Crossiella sp. CA-258035]WHT21606.1 ABC transporter substrate-binding protein [Crossiella sp. CA-258035]
MTALQVRSLKSSAVLVAAAALVLAGCANPENSGNPGTTGGGGEQVTKSAQPEGGSTCKIDAYGTPKIDLKDAVVGFSQSEKEANPFRIAETASIKAEAEKVGVKRMLTTNANSDLGKQISDIQSMLAQGAQLLIVAPLNSDGLEPALRAAREKKVPVLTVDRKLNAAKPCVDYLAFIGSDFVDQGKRAGESMIKVTGGSAKVAILLGSSGNNVTTDRTNGFKDAIKGTPGVTVVAEQTGDFSREKGQTVAEQLLQSKPEINAIYAENDEMAMGAINAIRAAGKKPGTDVRVVSVDGTRDAVQAIVDGNINGVIESNPRFGPLAFATMQKFLAGEAIPEKIIISDKAYDAANAKAEVNGAY